MQIDLFVDEVLLFHSKNHTTWNADLVFYADAKVLKLSGDFRHKLVIELITKDRELEKGGGDKYDLG